MAAAALPKHEREILAEHAAGEQRIVRERSPFITDMAVVLELNVSKNSSFHDVVNQLRESMKCPTCGKTGAVFNIGLGRRRHTPERVTPETHCACPATSDRPAGPAHGTRGA